MISLVNRSDDLRLIMYNLGLIMQGLGILVMFPVFLCFFYSSEVQYIPYFVVPGLVTFLVGWLLARFRVSLNMQLRHAMVISSLAWLIVAFVGSIPMYLLTDLTLFDAFFEAMSAWSGTGLTMYTGAFSLEELPHIILLWRSIQQWAGGIGVVLVAMLVLIRPGVSAARLYLAEARADRIKPTFVSTVKVMWKIYAIFTGIGIILFRMAGMPLFDSVNHSLTSIATAGMSIKDSSIGHYNSVNIELVAIFIMLIGAVNFTILYKVFFKGKIRAFFKDVQVQAFFVIAGFFLILLVLDLSKVYYPLEATRKALFQVITALTSCGLSTDNVAAWPEISKLLIILLMICGGGAGSTAGGVKLVRIVVVFKMLSLQIRRTLLPRNAITTVRIGAISFKEKDVLEALLFTLVYLLFLLVGGVILMYLGYGSLNSFFEMASVLGNNGLSVGITAPSLHPAGKIVLFFGMWMGRLEILPTLVFLANIVLLPFKRPNTLTE